MFVIDAVCMSMSVPFLFESVKYNKFTYLDGGTCETVPTLAFLNKDPKDVLVLRLELNKKNVPEIKSIREFINGVINVALNNRIIHKPIYKEIVFNLYEFNVFDFSMNSDEKLKLYFLGYQTALTQLGLDK
jgi:predicted acylesterase/phospholipase RssA